MKNLYIFLLYLVGCAISFGASAQGCVAVKNMASCSINPGENEEKSWQLSANYRYFRSYKHFRGPHEEKERVERGTEVINNDNSIILGATYNVNKSFSVSASVPLIFIDRSSLYEHYGNPQGDAPLNPRFHTQSNGFGDARITGNYNAITKEKINLSFGLGVKLPTGNFRVKDQFHRRSSTGADSTYTKVVDQSIQLGDGGFGFSTEFNVNVKIVAGLSGYVYGLYLFNPRNTNGVKRSANLTQDIPLSNEFSVADQYLARWGVSYTVKNMQFSLGGRYEGVAAEDVLGKSDGFRRPGYITSIEPSFGISIAEKHFVGLNLPVAVDRNRVQNTIDMKRSELNGERTIGDAAFADWLVSISYAYKL